MTAKPARMCTPIIGSKRSIVVFFVQVTTVDGERFSPRNDWGVADLRRGENPRDAAIRYIEERNITLNCPHCRVGDRGYELFLVAFTDSPGRIVASAMRTSEELREFLQTEENIATDMKLHREGLCPKKK